MIDLENCITYGLIYFRKKCKITDASDHYRIYSFIFYMFVCIIKIENDKMFQGQVVNYRAHNLCRLSYPL